MDLKECELGSCLKELCEALTGAGAPRQRSFVLDSKLQVGDGMRGALFVGLKKGWILKC